MKLALDHHYSPLIAQQLRRLGHDVLTAAEQGWETEEDDVLLALCAQEKRALLTNNVADFAIIARRWQSEGRSHFGLVFSSDASLPRNRYTIGRYVELLDALFRQHPDPTSLTERIHWL